jgi:tetratricopeptide (TPR) repeat protein
MRILLIVTLAAIFAFAPGLAAAASKPKPAKGTVLTEQDVRSCLGVDGSKPSAQIVACTKVINSGRVKGDYLADYYATRGAAYLANKQPGQAIADFNKALTIRQSAELYLQRGLAHMTKRSFDAAKTDLSQAIKLKPDFAPAYLMRGLAAYQAGQHKDALTDFDEAVKRVPTYYQALYARGVAKKKTGDDSGGDKDIKDARGMRPRVDEEMKKFGLTA